MPYEKKALRAKTVAQRLDIAESTLHDWCNPKSPRFDASFPKPVKLSAATVVWLSDMLDSWLLAKYEEQHGHLPEKDKELPAWEIRTNK